MKFIISFLCIVLCVACMRVLPKSLRVSLSNVLSGECKIRMNDDYFNASVQDSYDVPVIIAGMRYEAIYNTKLRYEISNIAQIIKSKSIPKEKIASLRVKVLKKMRSEIQYLTILSEYIRSAQDKYYDGQDLASFIQKSYIENIRDGMKMVDKYIAQLLVGDISYIAQSHRAFFCDQDVAKISISTNEFKAFLNAALAILSVLYDNVTLDKLPSLYNKGISYSKNSYANHTLLLPKNFIASSAYNDVKNSMYFTKSGSSFGFIIPSNSFIGLYLPNDTYQVAQLQYNPWYVNILSLWRDITPEFMVWSHRFYTKKGYVAVGFIDKMAEYNRFIDKMTPVLIKNPKRDIKPGYFFIKRIYNNCVGSSCIDGSYGVTGIVMDYNPADDTIIVMSEYSNIQGGAKSGIGYEAYKYDTSESTEYFFFKPSLDTITDVKSIGGYNADVVKEFSSINSIENSANDKLDSKAEDSQVKDSEFDTNSLPSDTSNKIDDSMIDKD